MREIKFRAWNKIEKKMYYLDLWQFKKEDVRIFAELMQYTGLKDKNKKEIYEGDIVKHSEWEDNGVTKPCLYEVYWAKEGSWAYNSLQSVMFMQFEAKDCKVIGNIYENKELIQKR